MDEVKIGLLVPRSVQYPKLSFHFVEGVRSYLVADGRVTYNLFIEDVGVGATQAVVMDKCQRLLLQHQVDVVVAYVGNRVAVELASLFNNLKKILIITNWGENRIFHPFSPFVFNHSLGLWKTCWEMGFHIATHMGKNILATTSFYDSGYGLLHAVYEGVEAGNGTIVKTEIVPEIEGKPVINKLAQTAQELNPDIICGIFSGIFASGFLSRYFQHDILRQVPLTGPVNIMDKTLPENTGADIYVASPFRYTVNGIGQANDSFFYIHGSEIGQIIQYAFGHGLPANINDVTDKLADCYIESPRGRVEMQEQLHTTMAPSYLACYNKQGIKEIGLLNNFSSAHLLMGDASQFSGFFNPYLCV